MKYPDQFDVVVIGGGHAGTEGSTRRRADWCTDVAGYTQHRDDRTNVL